MDKLFFCGNFRPLYTDILKSIRAKYAQLYLDVLENNVKYPMIVKTLSGSYGSGVFMVEDRKQFRQLMKMAM